MTLSYLRKEVFISKGGIESDRFYKRVVIEILLIKTSWLTGGLGLLFSELPNANISSVWDMDEPVLKMARKRIC